MMEFAPTKANYRGGYWLMNYTKSGGLRLDALEVPLILDPRRDSRYYLAVARRHAPSAQLARSMPRALRAHRPCLFRFRPPATLPAEILRIDIHRITNDGLDRRVAITFVPHKQAMQQARSA